MNRCSALYYQFIFLIIFLSGGCGTSDVPVERTSVSLQTNIAGNRAIFHDDGQCLAMAPAENPEKFIIEYIDRELSDVPITTFCILAATPDLTLFDSTMGEVITERYNFEKDSYRAIKTLREHGTDILKLAAQHLKPKGIEVLAAIRMGDTHHKNLDPETLLAPQFAIDHPEYVIKQPDGRTTETALDYSYPEVREHRLAIMREAAEKYNIDGLELNFCRWGKHFPIGQGCEKAHILTSYMADIQEMLNESASKRSRQHLTLGVVVPEGIESCWKAGIDIESWINRKLVDYIIVSTWNETDLQVPIGEFADLTDGTGIPVYAMMGNLIMGGGWVSMPKIAGRGTGQFRDTYGGMLLTVPEARACAANYYAWGADGIAFWNVGCHMGPAGSRTTAQPVYWEQMWSWMKTVLDSDRIYEGERCYHYLPNYKELEYQGPKNRNYAYFNKGMSPLGAPKYTSLEFPHSDTATAKTFRFRMADGRNGETINGSMQFWLYHITTQDSVSVALNGKAIDPTNIHKYQAGELRLGIPGVRFEIDLVNCNYFTGDNKLKITLHTFPDTTEIPFMEELEVTIR